MAKNRNEFCAWQPKPPTPTNDTCPTKCCGSFLFFCAEGRGLSLISRLAVAYLGLVTSSLVLKLQKHSSAVRARRDQNNLIAPSASKSRPFGRRFCAEGRARTGDPILFRDMLYQLSYLGRKPRLP